MKMKPKSLFTLDLPDADKSNYWDTHRALAAFHVYVHLVLFFKLAEQRGAELADVYGPLDQSSASAGSLKAVGRAHYLAEQLREVSWPDLGLAGRRLVDWFDSVLDALDDALDSRPPPQGSYVHLLLDRYNKEARAIERLLSKPKQPPELLQELAVLANNE